MRVAIRTAPRVARRVVLPAIWVSVSAGGQAATTASAAPTVTYQTVARQGNLAPGTAPNTRFLNFYFPSINNAGQIVFSGRLFGGDAAFDTNQVLYTGVPGALQLVARSGSAAPGMPAGVTYGQIHNPTAAPFFTGQSVINDAGQIAFQAQLAGPGVGAGNDVIAYAGTPGALQVAVREGDAAPDASGAVFSTFGLFLNDSGQVALHTRLTGTGVTTGNFTAVYLGTPGAALTKVARDGDPVPAATGANYGGNGGSLGQLTINDAGRVAFWDTVNGPGIDSTNSAAVFASTGGPGGGAVQIAARNGSPVPGEPAGVIYRSVFPHTTAVNNAGQVAFRSILNGGGITSANDDTVFAGTIGAPQIVAREGNQAPDLPAGVNYAGFAEQTEVRSPHLNDAGQILFTATLTGPGVTSANNDAIFAGDLSSPRLVVREGTQAPGLPAGVTLSSFFGGFLGGMPIPSPAFNEAGQIAGLMFLTGPGVGSANDVALYLFDPVEGAVLVAREGMAFDVGGGELRTVADFGIEFAGAKNDDTTFSFNDAGTMVFALKFTDGTSGLFTAAIPEPASGMGVIACATTACLRRRRPRT